MFAACGTPGISSQRLDADLILDWIPVGMANICAEARGRQLGR